MKSFVLFTLLVFTLNCGNSKSDTNSKETVSPAARQTEQIQSSPSNNNIVIKGFYLGMKLRDACQNAFKQLRLSGVPDDEFNVRYGWETMGCRIWGDSLILGTGNKRQHLDDYADFKIIKTMDLMMRIGNSINNYIESQKESIERAKRVKINFPDIEVKEEDLSLHAPQFEGTFEDLYYRNSSIKSNLEIQWTIFDDKNYIFDDWGNKLFYKVDINDIKNYFLVSYGPDGAPDTEDDIVLNNDDFVKSKIKRAAARDYLQNEPCNCDDEIVSITMDPSFVNRVFNVYDMTAERFIQDFINSYNIPKMNYQEQESTHSVGRYWEYISDRGERIVINEYKTIIINKVPSVSERKFD